MNERLNVGAAAVALAGYGLTRLPGVGFDIAGGVLLFLGSLTAIVTGLYGCWIRYGSGRER